MDKGMKKTSVKAIMSGHGKGPPSTPASKPAGSTKAGGVKFKTFADHPDKSKVK